MVSVHASTVRARRGFTLIEVMIVVAIAGILAAVAYPSFMEQVRKARRSDAMDVVARVQQAQERWRANNAQYASLASLGIPSASPGGYYTITSAAGAGARAADSFTVTATAVSGKSQAGDTGCNVMKLTVSGVATTVDTFPVLAGNPTFTPPTCWKR